MNERDQQGRPEPPGAIGRGRIRVGGGEPSIQPADQVTPANIVEEESESVGGDVEPALPQCMVGQRAAGEVIGLGAGSDTLAEAYASGEGRLVREV